MFRISLVALCVLFVGQQVFAEPPAALKGNGLCIGKRHQMSQQEFDQQKSNCKNQHRRHWHFRKTRERKERECIEELEHERIKSSESFLYCCDGYEEVQGECKPRCEPHCEQGECVAPNQCNCAINFSGPTCNETCSPGRFGPDCELSCGDMMYGALNSSYVHCSCSSPESGSSRCKEICKCMQPNCSPGWVGLHCDVPCPENTYGDFCMGNCTCRTDGTRECSKDRGQCLCRDEYYGSHCEHKLSAFQLTMGFMRDHWAVSGLVCISIGSLVLLVILFAVYTVRRRSATPLRFLTARYSHTTDKENPIYHIGTLPCTNQLREGKPDKLDDSATKEDENGRGENLYESIDKDE